MNSLNLLSFNIPTFDFTSKSIVPMEIDTPRPPKPKINLDYQGVAKLFMETFCPAFNQGMDRTNPLYDPLVQMTLKIGFATQHEFLGYQQFINLLTGYGIWNILLSDINYSSQPLGKSSILIQSHGNIKANYQHEAKFTMSVVLKKTLTGFSIGQEIFHLH